MVAWLFAAVAGAAAGLEARGSKNNGFLAAVNRMQPTVAAHSLARVEGQWRSEVLQFSECNAESSHGDCAQSQKAFEKSCSTIVTAVVAASSGDCDTVKEYMGVVCDEPELKGWKQERCTHFTHSITETMTADSWDNREQLDVSGLCVRFWANVSASEASRVMMEHEEQAKKLQAERAEAAEQAKESAVKAAAEEAARKAAAEAEAAAEKKRKQAEEQHRQAEEQRRKVEAAKAAEAKRVAKARAATKKGATKKKNTKIAAAKKTVATKKKVGTKRAAVNKRTLPTKTVGATKKTAATVKPAAATNTETKKTVAVQKPEEHAQVVSHASEMESAEEEEDEVDKKLREAEQEEEETRLNIAQAQSKADQFHHATSKTSGKQRP